MCGSFWGSKDMDHQLRRIWEMIFGAWLGSELGPFILMAIF